MEYEWGVFVRYLPFPIKVEGVTLPNSDGTFSVYINSNLSNKKQMLVFQHELDHIKKDHFYDSDPVVYNELSVETAV